MLTFELYKVFLEPTGKECEYFLAIQNAEINVIVNCFDSKTIREIKL